MRLTTEQARAQLLDYCAGMLPASEAAQVELALLDDAVLAEEAQRLRDLLGAAKRADALEWTAERSTANFAAVAAALSAAGQLEADAWLAPVAEVPVAEEVPATTPQRTSRRLAAWGWVAAAAALLIGLSASNWMRADAPDPLAAPEQAAAPVLPQAEVAKVAPRVDVWASLARDASRPEGFPGSIFAGSAAEWRAQQERDWTVYLAGGALLVEWMPAGVEHLIVRTPGESIEVTGTVFAIEVTPEATEVSVVEGSVVVSRTDGSRSGERTLVERGGRWRSDAEEGAISGAVSTAAGLRVDLAAHRSWMASRGSKPAASVAEMRPAAQRSKAVAPAALGPAAVTEPALDGQADAAVARGDHAGAAALLEQWVVKAPAQTTRRAAKLDLARIYLYELRQPERAASHLRELIEAAPSDLLAATLRSELCSLRLPKDAPHCGAK
ncbi:MAG: FecR domain-containing protein [Deltaproteobacteria bacterium]|nr:FecR domain-containing protein [Deltaproteobacteria bacterium]